MPERDQPWVVNVTADGTLAEADLVADQVRRAVAGWILGAGTSDVSLEPG